MGEIRGQEGGGGWGERGRRGEGVGREAEGGGKISEKYDAEKSRRMVIRGGGGIVRGEMEITWGKL